MMDRGKKNLLGVRIDAIDYESAVVRVIASAQQGWRCTVGALAVHGVMMGATDFDHRYRLNHLDLSVPDGQPVRWALNALHGTKLRDRVYGPKLTLLVCREAARTGIPVFFYGSRDEVVLKLTAKMIEQCPGLQVAGYQASKFKRLTPAERQSLVEGIRESGAKILFVGLGCPRQEVFAYEMGERLSMPILAVGAAFDYHSGILSEPPEFMQRAGLQWLYRLAQDPRRLWRRYLVLNTQFIMGFMLQILHLRVADPSNATRPSTEMYYG
jgi:N-acetylglucosaminyldiphosphoundecaprenol N-acetyl-beta-D-mannosaminyltransferase